MANASPSTGADFSGLYIGVNFGHSWGRSTATTQTTFVPGSYFAASDIAQINASGHQALTLNGFIGGIQGGFNYQTNNLVLGTEIDFDSFSTDSSRTSTVSYQSAPQFAFTLQNETKTNWLFTARPRIGWVINKAMIYTTVGLALTNLRSENTFSDNFNSPPLSDAFENGIISKNKAGWILGGGIEAALLNNLSLKAEYLFMDFGHASTSGSLSLNPAFLAPPLVAPSPFNHTINLTSNIVRFGLNYKFKNF